jgi:hypothetical protein
MFCLDCGRPPTALDCFLLKNAKLKFTIIIEKFNNIFLLRQHFKCQHVLLFAAILSSQPIASAGHRCVRLKAFSKKESRSILEKKTDKSEASNNTPNDTRGDRKAGQGDCRPDDKVFRADWGHLAFSPAAANRQVWAGEVPPDTRGNPTAKKPWPPKFLQH